MSDQKPWPILTQIQGSVYVLEDWQCSWMMLLFLRADVHTKESSSSQESFWVSLGSEMVHENSGADFP